MKLQLVAYWREFWRHWSVQLGALGMLFISGFVMFPDYALQAWVMLPSDLKAMLPQQLVGYIGIGILVLSFIAKFIKQKNLPSNKNES
jgi:hypothetical protein